VRFALGFGAQMEVVEPLELRVFASGKEAIAFHTNAKPSRRVHVTLN